MKITWITHISKYVSNKIQVIKATNKKSVNGSYKCFY